MSVPLKSRFGVGRLSEVFRRFCSAIKSHGRICEELSSDTEFTGRLNVATELIVSSLRGGGTVYVAGNGGSAATASHFAAEMVGRFVTDRGGLRCISLASDVSLITALTNDFPIEKLFSRQLRAHARLGDVLVCFTTSGRSPNIIDVVTSAADMQLPSIVFCGEHREAIRHATAILSVPSTDVPRIQEVHDLVMHVLCESVEVALA